MVEEFFITVLQEDTSLLLAVSGTRSWYSYNKTNEMH
jgi:hypothetical protein